MSGYSKIYEDLIERLKYMDIAASAERLGLSLNKAGEANVPFLDTTFLVSNDGVRRLDSKGFYDAAGSVIIHYLLKGSRCWPIGKFVTFSELAGPLFKQSSYSSSALEQPIIRRFQGRIPELSAAAAFYGGRQEGEAGSGALSFIFDLLPHVLLQLIFYDQDDEFSARATLLFDLNATQFVDFEVLAVLVTLFVHSLTKS
jgi:Domain of unknown function (DUF3786)